MENQNDKSFIIRNMTPDDLKTVMKWAEAEGWNPGIHDADTFYAADPDGFFIGEFNGEPIASIAAVAYDENFGFIGLYLVRKDFRGKGYGLKIWNCALEYLKHSNIGMDGTINQELNYRKFGFKLAYKNIRYEGISDGVMPKGVANLSSVPFHDILEYDSKVFPVPRPLFLRRWINQPDSSAMGILHGIHLAGYGVIRKCVTGNKVGPLFADDEYVAEHIFEALISTVKGENVYLNIPETNINSLRLAERHRMKPVFQTARMYTLDFPVIDITKVFSITSFELG